MRWPKLVMGFTQSTTVDATIDADGIDEDGAPIVGESWSGRCNWQDATVRRFSRDRSDVEVKATLIIDGDPFPSMWTIDGGYVEIDGVQRTIEKASKARNPDGTVNFTTIWVR